MEDQERRKILREHGLWEGWSDFCDSIPLGPGKTLELPPKPAEPKPEEVGFGYPLAPVQFAERRVLPPSDEDAFAQMYALLHGALKDRQVECSEVLSAVYRLIDSNRRDSPVWQRAFMQVGGLGILLSLLKEPGTEQPLRSEAGTGASEKRGTEQPQRSEAWPGASGGTSLSVHYWVVALLGRMMGTCEASRRQLIEEGAVDVILEATKSSQEDVRECAICGLKGLVQHPEGREKVTYQTMLQCLAGRRR